MTSIDIRHLELLTTVADTGSLTKASQRLHVTQPALSHRLSDIESKLGVRLFVRGKRQMTLTQAGRRLQRTALVVLQELNDAEKAIARMVGGEVNVLKVGTTCMLSYRWLPRVMASFEALHPCVDIDYRSTRDLEGDLLTRQLDVVITSLEAVDSRICLEDVFVDEIVVVMLPGHELAARTYVELQDFHDRSLVSFTELPKEQLYETHLKPVGIAPRKLTRVEQPEAALALVQSGFGVSLLPRFAVQHLLDAGVLCARPITEAGVQYRWKVARLKTEPQPAYQEAFIRLVARHGTP